MSCSSNPTEAQSSRPGRSAEKRRPDLSLALQALPVTPIRADERWREQCIRYSICTIVTRPDQYQEMLSSFVRRGFCEPECEFLYIDNTDCNTFDAFLGYNLFLNVARGEYIILCHQDIVLLDDGRATLDAILTDLTKLDCNWGVCGNVGVTFPAGNAIQISDPHGADQRVGELPAKVRSLDENFIIARRFANVALSHDLQGFHLYGTDICIIAEMLGCTCYVIDFHLEHKSGGARNTSFFSIRDQLVRKCRFMLRSRWIATPCTIFFASGLPLLGWLMSSALPSRVARLVVRRSNWVKGMS